ncbi:hypothetical protein CDV36_012495 [Fusarium kuroshium]|uniref:Xylanolytic transcriptional activator regulatory domain-containing protein n=1 Tax=Fusarium kuroshium TaxID=2010991 RepID=A0A3M2RRE6_9HYPO|nr:hypothetical protein CDV36_012495 [Fusarium kuroshium]
MALGEPDGGGELAEGVDPDLPSSLDMSGVDDGTSCVEAMHDLGDFLNAVGFNFDLNIEPLYPSASSTGDHEEVYQSPSTVATPDLTAAPSSTQTPSCSTEAPLSDTPEHHHSVQNEFSVSSDNYQQMKTFTQPWKVTEDQRTDFQRFLLPFSLALEGFILPSRITMSRYIAGYVEGFTHHHPFIHMPTFSIVKYKDVPELVMAIMAIGAQYRYEHLGGHALYHASRAIIFHRQKLGELGHPLPSHSPPFSSCEHPPTVTTPATQSAFVRTGVLGALLLVAKLASWQQDQRLVQESIQYQYLLSKYAHDGGLTESEDDDGDDWEVWAQKEVSRRIKLGVFCFLNLQSLAFRTPPVLFSNEIRLRLPTSCKEWIAAGPEEWKAARADALPLVEYQDALMRLLQPTGETSVLTTSPFGNYILIHALLQRLTISRQLLLGPNPRSSPLPESSLLQMALDRWKDAWQRAPESVLDLRDPKDSLSWSAMSLLGLAHIRTHFDIGDGCQLQCSDPDRIALAAKNCHAPGRGPHLTQALLHSAHILNIPVQLGVSYLSNCQAYLWSIQHCICFFECTIFLSKWLWSVSACQSSELDAAERQLIGWIWTIVSEAQVSIQAGNDRISLSSRPDLQGEHSSTALRYLSVSIVDIHAKMFSQCNSVWPLMNVIGQSLGKYAGFLNTSLEACSSF